MADHDEVAVRLRMIADVLGVPVEEFYNGACPHKLRDTTECARLWHKLRTDEGRASVLACLRDALAKEAD